VNVVQHPGWIIAFFAIAAVVLLIIGAVRIFQAMRRLNAHVRALEASPMFADLDMLQLRLTRLQEIQPRFTEIAARAAAATAMLRDALTSAPLGDGSRALRDVRADIRALAKDLR